MSNYDELKLTYQGGRQETITLTDSTIDDGAYQGWDIVAVEVPEIVQTIGEYAFCDNNILANIVLNEGLQRIEGQAFQHGVYTAVTIPSTVTYIGWNAFNTSEEQGQDQHTFTLTCLATTPPTLDDPEGVTFGDPRLLSAIYVPDGSVSAYQEAWSAYASKIQGGTPADNMLTNLNIKAAYVGADEVVKMYLGNDVVWVYEEPDPCAEYEEGTQERCECEGKYWWDNSCHDEPKPVQEPLKLTFDFPADGRVKLYANNADIEAITLEPLGNPISVDNDGYFTYDPAEISGLHDVYFYFNNDVIYEHQFYNLPNLVAIHIPGNFTSVDSYAFAASDETPSNVTSITLDEGIERLEDRVFEEIRNVSAITIPQSVNYIGTNCFYKFGVYTPVVYTFLSDVPPTFDNTDSVLGQNPSGIWIMVPCNSKDAYNQATNNLYNGRFICSYDEIMEKTPLTFEITSVGTGETGSIGLRLSGDTDYHNIRQLTYYLTHEGTETSGDLRLREAAANSAITSLLSGLTVGDKIEFWGLGDQSGMSVSTSAFEYFVTTAGVTAKVYGNVNSLLFRGPLYHGQPVPQTAETTAYAFFRLFQNKTGFTFGAPDDLQHIVLPVPANGLQDSIYREMFYGCTNMTTAPNLPATTLAASCYRSMFNGAGLTTAPELPATTMAGYAYLSMFADCPITEAPQLPAATLAEYCYSNMFRGTNITDMPNLPATTLQQYCYQGMFSACTSLTGVTAVLPATTLAQYCYSYMFSSCKSLTTAPELPATTLANYCYQSMFQNCTSLTAAPELPATTLVDTCYGAMFSGCSSLNYIKCLATDIGLSFMPNTSGWVSGVALAGTFVKHPDMASWSTGNNGIPKGWTVQDAVITE